MGYFLNGETVQASRIFGLFWPIVERNLRLDPITRFAVIVNSILEEMSFGFFFFFLSVTQLHILSSIFGSILR